MRPLSLIAALGVVVLSVPPVSAQKPFGGERDASKYGWLSSLDDGKAQAKKSGKPLMVVIRCVP